MSCALKKADDEDPKKADEGEPKKADEEGPKKSDKEDPKKSDVFGWYYNLISFRKIMQE